MSDNEYQRFHNELGFSFDLYVVAHLESPLLEPVTDKQEAAQLVFLVNDPDFNAWSLQAAARCRNKDDVPDRPVAIYHVPISCSVPVDGIDWTKARALGRFVLAFEKVAQLELSA